MIKFICIKGENRVGKDTLANKIEEKLNRRNIRVYKFSFATPLKDSLRYLYSHKFYKNGEDILNSDIKDETYIDMSSGDLFLKDDLPEGCTIIETLSNSEELDLNGKYISVRNLLKGYAENIIKQSFGKKVFANSVIGEVKDMYKKSNGNFRVVILTDFRFEEEYEALLGEESFTNCPKYHITVKKEGGLTVGIASNRFTANMVFHNKYHKDSMKYEQEVDGLLASII